MKQSIGLCMIVKDEAHVIERCLASTLPLADYVFVMDTGSTDGTQELIARFLRNHKRQGVVVEEPWVDFAANRTEALRRLRESTMLDYVLVIDADEVLEFADGFDAAAFKAGLSCDLYDVTTRYGNIEYIRPQLLRNDVPFYYRGVVHEFLESKTPARTRSVAEGFWNRPIQDGARSLDPDKFFNDAVTIGRALLHETDPFLRTRYTFYQAQCYRDANLPYLAIGMYRARTNMGGWDQEVYISHLNIARLSEAVNDDEAALEEYKQAAALCPGRAEAWHGMARLSRKQGHWDWAYRYAADAMRLPKSPDALFSEVWIHDYGAADELAVAASWLGRFAESLRLCRDLLQSGKVPQSERSRIMGNMQHAEAAVAESRRNVLMD